MAGINQVQVNPKAGLTFASALRRILRSDPDVVLVGEIRDQETAQIAIEAALTGHLVLSTLHTNDAPSAMTRLIEIGIEPFLVGSASPASSPSGSRAASATSASQAVRATREELAALRFSYDPRRPAEAYRPVGCAACSNTGYRGRMALHEVMTLSEDLERLAVAGARARRSRRRRLEQGMATLRDDGFAKALQGLTSIEEILRVVAARARGRRCKAPNVNSRSTRSR